MHVSAYSSDTEEWSINRLSLEVGTVYREWQENTQHLPVKDAGSAPYLALAVQGNTPTFAVGHMEWKTFAQFSQAYLHYEGFVQFPDGSISPHKQQNFWQTNDIGLRLDWLLPMSRKMNLILTSEWGNRMNTRNLLQYSESIDQTYQQFGFGLRVEPSDRIGLQIQVLQGSTSSTNIKVPKLDFFAKLPANEILTHEIQGWWTLNLKKDRLLMRLRSIS